MLLFIFLYEQGSINIEEWLITTAVCLVPDVPSGVLSDANKKP